MKLLQTISELVFQKQTLLTDREQLVFFPQQRIHTWFSFTLVTGCHEKPTDGHTTDHGDNSGNGSYDGSCKVDNSCSYQNGGSPLPETTVATAAASAADATSAFVGDWRTVAAADLVPAPGSGGGDTSIRCVVQPPPDMLATHVCVEVGLVKSAAAASEQPEMPTIVVCSVDVEPCRKPAPSDVAGKCPAPTPEREDGVGDDVLDRISQDLDYLLNRKCVDAATDRSHVERNRQKKQKPLKSLNDVHLDASTQRRTRL